MPLNEFSTWLDLRERKDCDLLPVAHVSKSDIAKKIIDTDKIEPQNCDVLNSKVSYGFYGRSAYRVKVDGTITQPALAPICFLLDGRIAKKASRRFPFDSGAFSAQRYSNALQRTAALSDFEIYGKSDLPDRLIEAYFTTTEKYIDGDATGVRPLAEICAAEDFVARAYYELITAAATNQPDDRMHTVELVFSGAIELKRLLKALIVPHTFWGPETRSKFLTKIDKRGIPIRTYFYVPNRSPDYYQAHIEDQVRSLFREWGHYQDV